MYGRGARVVGGMHGRGVCMAGWGHAWQGGGGMSGRGRHAWQGGHVCQGACVAGGCMAGGMCGRGGHAWQILQDTVNARAV